MLPREVVDWPLPEVFKRALVLVYRTRVGCTPEDLLKQRKSNTYLSNHFHALDEESCSLSWIWIGLKYVVT